MRRATVSYTHLHDKLIDCGLLIYDRERQEVFAGGSGCACSAVVTIAYLFDLLRTKALHKIMVVATGALLSTVIVQQKESDVYKRQILIFRLSVCMAPVPIPR